jgi:hypothetical protein
VPGSTLAGVITATATVITALGGLALAIAVLLPALRASRAAEANSAKTIAEVAKVHTIVNQQRTDAQRYQIALVTALQDAGIKVPADQSLSMAPASVTGSATAIPEGSA